MEKIHELKIYPEDFEQMLDGSKPFLAIKNDKNFQKGDMVQMKEWNNRWLFGKEICGVIESVADDKIAGIEKGYAVIFIRICKVIV